MMDLNFLCPIPKKNKERERRMDENEIEEDWGSFSFVKAYFFVFVGLGA